MRRNRCFVGLHCFSSTSDSTSANDKDRNDGESGGDQPKSKAKRKRQFPKERIVHFADLIKQVTQSLPTSVAVKQTDIKVIVQHFFDAVSGNLENQNKVFIRKFGSFYPYPRKGRKKLVETPNLNNELYWCIKFRPFEALKVAVKANAKFNVTDEEDRERLGLDNEEDEEEGVEQELEKIALPPIFNGSVDRAPRGRGQTTADDSIDSESDKDVDVAKSDKIEGHEEKMESLPFWVGLRKKK